MHSVETKSQMDCELCVSQKVLTALLPFFSAEDSNGCQHIVEFDILTLLDSQARGCQFTVRKREAQCLV